MKQLGTAILAAVIAAPVAAQEHRELGAHVHGVTTMDIAIEHGAIEIGLHAPGADIVGFEYTPETDADKKAVEAAIAKLSQPDLIFSFSQAADCRPIETKAELKTEDGHDDHHDDHAEHKDHDDHHGHDHDHAHDEAGHHDDHADEHHDDAGAEHSEFHASYRFACANLAALTEIGFPFFDQFPNAQEIEARYINETRVGAAEVERGDPRVVLQK